ncbi:TPA: hypothetical protein J1413_004781 [Escherichia coli]|nr:hypothetical protein [Escherichia coli]HAX0302281.1 hypothetical protein [Escherichia coli CD471]HBA9513433.1 hypothetical protein [Escherichia coli]HBA9522959.1 hypothetical protein [Escherichia coli]HBA9550881.1 hypothetical protein [Escherichia coli]
MNIVWLIKTELFVIVFLVGAFLAASFVVWENPFRYIRPLFAVRVLIASVVVVWFVLLCLYEVKL